MLYCGMARLSALLGRVDRLFVLHLLSHRDFTLAELGRATGRPPRQVEAFVAELEAAGFVVSGNGRGHRFYNLATDEIRDLVAGLVAPDLANGRQRRHLRLVHSRDGAAAPPTMSAEPRGRPDRHSDTLRAESTGT